MFLNPVFINNSAGRVANTVWQTAVPDCEAVFALCVNFDYRIFSL